jgi:hypothetical protein
MDKIKSMKMLLCAALIGVLPFPLRAQSTSPTVSIRHISTAYANQGICSLRFGLGTSMGDGDAGEVTIKLRFVDPKGRELLQGEISASLNDSEAGRYQEVFLEDPSACLDSSTKVQVLRATAKIGKKKFDLLKLRKLVLDDFKPMLINISK